MTRFGKIEIKEIEPNELTKAVRETIKRGLKDAIRGNGVSLAQIIRKYKKEIYK